MCYVSFNSRIRSLNLNYEPLLLLFFCRLIQCILTSVVFIKNKSCSYITYSEQEREKITFIHVFRTTKYYFCYSDLLPLFICCSIKVNVSDPLSYWILSTDILLITINAVLAIVAERKFSLKIKKKMLFQKNMSGVLGPRKAI